MKIIKQSDLKPIYRGKCGCGCIFECEEHEVKLFSEDSFYHATCPCCHVTYIKVEPIKRKRA